MKGGAARPNGSAVPLCADVTFRRGNNVLTMPFTFFRVAAGGRQCSLLRGRPLSRVERPIIVRLHPYARRPRAQPRGSFGPRSHCRGANGREMSHCHRRGRRAVICSIRERAFTHRAVRAQCMCARKEPRRRCFVWVRGLIGGASVPLQRPPFLQPTN